MKSHMLNVFWPAWEWGPMNMPYLRHLAFAPPCVACPLSFLTSKQVKQPPANKAALSRACGLDRAPPLGGFPLTTKGPCRHAELVKLMKRLQPPGPHTTAGGRSRSTASYEDPPETRLERPLNPRGIRP
jgi:hypothetical protein